MNNGVFDFKSTQKVNIDTRLHRELHKALSEEVFFEVIALAKALRKFTHLSLPDKYTDVVAIAETSFPLEHDPFRESTCMRDVRTVVGTAKELWKIYSNEKNSVKTTLFAREVIPPLIVLARKALSLLDSSNSPNLINTITPMLDEAECSFEEIPADSLHKDELVEKYRPIVDSVIKALGKLI